MAREETFMTELPGGDDSSFPAAASSRIVLAVDVGGTNLKVKCAGNDEVRRSASGRDMTAEKMAAAVSEMTADWTFDLISVGYPGLVINGKIAREPFNLGPGWLDFDFAEAFGKPVKVINDAAMQALGAYEGGRMLFLGIGTGFGSALILNGIVQPLELGHLSYKKGRTYEDFAGKRGQRRLGKRRWRKAVTTIIQNLSMALQPDYVVVGGGEAKKLRALPQNCHFGSNADAFEGGFRMWTDTRTAIYGALTQLDRPSLQAVRIS